MGNLTGKTIANQYRLDTFIGRGNKTEVFKIWDVKYKTVLALKLLYVDLDINRVFFDRLVMDARILAKLRHPNIVGFYRLGQDGEYAFIVMEYIDGGTLKQKFLTTKSPLPFDNALEIMRPLCNVLQYIHSQGIVHADVKPSNILIDKRGRIVLADFSTAQLMESVPDLLGAGTPGYMAPEQVQGYPPTQQSDIYSLGIVLYELLSGELPFIGTLATFNGSLAERIRWERVNLKPPPLRDKNPNISRELENVVLKALSIDPMQRYASVKAFLQSVESV